MADWHFEKSPEMGGASGEAFANPLLGSGSIESLVAREALQNSCDAQADPDIKVAVSFRLTRLRGAAKQGFLDAAAFVPYLLERQGLLNLVPGSVLDHARDGDHPLDVFFIEDFNTTGLIGDPHSQKSKFNRLLLFIGDAGKTRGKEGSGGSFGFGKAVYSVASKVRTIFAYTEIDPSEDATAVSARLLGCSYFPAHEFDGKDHTGRAWFGELSKRKRDVYDPLTDEAARSAASGLGFVRRPGQYGTSVLIIDCAIDLDALRKEIELWWWPRIVEDDLDVEILSPDGGVAHPRPKLRPELQPFIECYDLAVGRSEPEPHQRTKALNRIGSFDLGVYGFASLDDERTDAMLAAPVTLSGSGPQRLFNRVALIRKPRMVVAYEPFGRTSPVCVGTFVAHETVDNFLRFSEPSTHNRWDKDSPRLPQAGPDAAAIVEAVLKRLASRFRDFQSEVVPKPSEGKKLRFMERLLAEYVAPSSEPGGDGGKPAGPVHLTFPETSVISKGSGLAARASFKVRLKDEAPGKAMQLHVEVRAPLIEDETTEGEAVPVQLACNTHFLQFDDDSGSAGDFTLTKDETAVFSVETDAYDPGWTTKLVVTVTPIGTNENGEREFANG